jgi:hypothetical protein
MCINRTKTLNYCTFHGLGPLACTNSEFTSENMNLLDISVGLLGQVICPSRGFSTHTGQHNTEKCGHTSMPRAGFEPTIPVFEWYKTITRFTPRGHWEWHDELNEQQAHRTLKYRFRACDSLSMRTQWSARGYATKCEWRVTSDVTPFDDVGSGLPVCS